MKLNVFLAPDLGGPTNPDNDAFDDNLLAADAEEPWMREDEYNVYSGGIQHSYSGRSSFDEHNADFRESRLSAWRGQTAPRAYDAPHLLNSLGDESMSAASSDNDIDFRDGFRDNDGLDVDNTFNPNRRRESADTTTSESINSNSAPVSEFD